MENERRRSSAQKMRKTFVGGFALMILMLLVLNFQIAGLSDQLGELNNVLTGAAVADPEPTAPADPGEEPPADVDMAQLAEGAPYKGEADAPVTIVEWSDFRCPFCERFYSETLPLIEENYIDNGDVRFVYRHFPVVGGDTEAEATVCADEQGLFWEIHDAIYDNFDGYTEADLATWIEEFGGNVEEYEECIDSGRAREIVQQDQQLGIAVGVQGTPGFVINGEVVSGAQPFNVFEQVIEEALN